MSEELPNTMEEVAELMRQNLPQEMSPSEFGRRMCWGRGSGEALQRKKTIAVEDLEGVGLSAEAATQWAIAYEAVAQLMPNNPSAKGRAALMRYAAKLLLGV